MKYQSSERDDRPSNTAYLAKQATIAVQQRFDANASKRAAIAVSRRSAAYIVEMSSVCSAYSTWKPRPLLEPRYSPITTPAKQYRIAGRRPVIQASRKMDHRLGPGGGLPPAAAGRRPRASQISSSTTEKARNAPNAIFDDMASPSAIKNTGMRTSRGTASSTRMKGLSTSVTQELAANKAPNGSASAAPITN